MEHIFYSNRINRLIRIIKHDGSTYTINTDFLLINTPHINFIDLKRKALNELKALLCSFNQPTHLHMLENSICSVFQNVSEKIYD